MAALCQNEDETQRNHHKAELSNSENEDESDMVNGYIHCNWPAGNNNNNRHVFICII